MADSVATQIISESGAHLIVKLTNVSDGTGESGVVKVDVSALTPAANEVAIQRIDFATFGMGARLFWDASTPVHIWTIPQDDAGSICFQKAGILLVNDAGAGKTGDIKITTFGHTLGDSYSIILHLRKS